jgi:uncharacterized membrane protein YhfC
MNIPFIVSALVIQFPLMLVLPILLGWWLKRRFGLGWGVFAMGMITFVASQVIHIPLNLGLEQLAGDPGMDAWPLLLTALVAGLSAGLCENLTRWVLLRFVFKHLRGWRQALQFGAGHGAIESIFFGVLALVTLIRMILLQTGGLDHLQLGAEELAQAEAALQAYWSYPWYVPLLAGLERVLTITFHIAMAVLVMRSVTRNQVGYLLAAIVAHTGLDSWAVWGMQKVGLVGVEAGLVLFAAFGLWLIFRFQERPGDPVPQP